jgi:hypothetical protein
MLIGSTLLGQDLEASNKIKQFFINAALALMMKVAVEKLPLSSMISDRILSVQNYRQSSTWHYSQH